MPSVSSWWALGRAGPSSLAQDCDCSPRIVAGLANMLKCESLLNNLNACCIMILMILDDGVGKIISDDGYLVPSKLHSHPINTDAPSMSTVTMCTMLEVAPSSRCGMQTVGRVVELAATAASAVCQAACTDVGCTACCLAN